ncbi:MAG: hypothetical protein ABR906_11415 [Terracidiphilus sp.]|jgi:hypothetical protein
MKLAIRIFALTLVVAGVSAASTPTTAHFVSHLSATGPLPTPGPTPDRLPYPTCCVPGH